MSRLRVRVVGEESQWAELPSRGKLVVGSSEDRADFVLSGQGVDATHCAIGRIKSGGWAVMDLGSKYGTILNGAPVQTARISLGDRLVVGSRSLEFVDGDAPASKPEVSTPAATPESAPAASEPQHATPAPNAKRLGGYRLDRQLGRGGMGEVWLALQESLNRPVALKILSTKLNSDQDFVAAFQREARAAAALSHPNVVIVHDVGAADGHHFLSMEYMAGGSLEDRVAREGALPWRQVLDALHDAGKGLMFAEERQIVHRDIKPANLMVGGQGTIKIADLGLATSMEAEEGAGEDAGGKRILGTPHFISPEQARGEPVDHRADLYSLGATAYRLLTGRTPFEGETTREILRGHFTQAPVPPSERVPGVPEGLERVVLKLLEKEPGARFASAKELVTAVDRLRLEADHVDLPNLAGKSGGGLAKLLIPAFLIAALGAAAFFVLDGRSKDASTNGGTTTPVAGTEPTDTTESGTGGLDPEFFTDGGGQPTTDATAEAALENELRVQDLQAQLAFRDVPSDATTAERADALREIAAQYPGTATATACLTEVGELEAELAASAARAERLGGLLEVTLGDLRRDLGWPLEGADAPRPIDTLRKLEAFQVPADLAEGSLWHDSVATLRTELLSETTQQLTARFEAAKGLRDSGDFVGLRDALVALATDLELPPVDAQGQPNDKGLAPLRSLATEVRAARDNLENDQELFEAQAIQLERERLAAALGPGSGAVEAFAKIDPTLVAEHIERLAGSPPDSAGAKLHAVLTGEHAAVKGLFTSMVVAWQTGNWRRRTTADPRDSRRASIAILQVSKPGLILGSEDGAGELVPWSAFGEDPLLLEQLFKGRLDRAYTADENRGILALIRWSLAARAAGSADRAYSGAALRSGDAGVLAECLTTVPTILEWSDMGALELAESTQRLRDELAACSKLMRAFSQSKAGAWSESIAALEDLYLRFPDSLVVRLLSDASAWEEDDA